MIDVSSARDEPANMADIPTSAASVIVTPECGKMLIQAMPSSAPVAPPMVSSGASVPPEVPLPSATDHEINFIRHKEKITFIGRLPDRISVMLTYPTPIVRG